MISSPRFSGEVVEYYARFRRGYPPEVVDRIAEAFALTPDDVVLDLGCGTGQLTAALTQRVGTVIGMDPEPDMLTAAATAHAGPDAPIVWVLGSDRDVPALGRALRPLGCLTVAVAIHWMDRDALFAHARRMLRPGGGVAVVTNGQPLWLQDADWSRELQAFLHEWTGRAPSACQTDEAGRRRTREALVRAGYEVTETSVDYQAPLTVEDAVGGVLSAMDLPPEAERQRFAAELGQRLHRHAPITEEVSVMLQLGTAGTA